MGIISKCFGWLTSNSANSSDQSRLLKKNDDYLEEATSIFLDSFPEKDTITIAMVDKIAGEIVKDLSKIPVNSSNNTRIFNRLKEYSIANHYLHTALLRHLTTLNQKNKGKNHYIKRLVLDLNQIDK